uniref:C2H2-type domain-containing protein n=1 Tax=Chrysemys picta bellii TaxID=8478 RepID=A0A8C3HZ01_CHRPI
GSSPPWQRPLLRVLVSVSSPIQAPPEAFGRAGWGRDANQILFCLMSPALILVWSHLFPFLSGVSFLPSTGSDRCLDSLSLLPGNWMVSENEEQNPQQVDAEQLEPHGTLAGRCKEKVSGSCGEAKACEGQHRPEKTFSSCSDLIRHERINMEERPYTCYYCEKSFNHSSNLSRHRRVHTGERPYTCAECEKSFIRRSHLITHQRIHTGERSFTCPECGKSFRQDSAFMRHKRTHTGE